MYLFCPLLIVAKRMLDTKWVQKECLSLKKVYQFFPFGGIKIGLGYNFKKHFLNVFQVIKAQLDLESIGSSLRID